MFDHLCRYLNTDVSIHNDESHNISFFFALPVHNFNIQETFRRLAEAYEVLTTNLNVEDVAGWVAVDTCEDQKRWDAEGFPEGVSVLNLLRGNERDIKRQELPSLKLT